MPEPWKVRKVTALPRLVRSRSVCVRSARRFLCLQPTASHFVHGVPVGHACAVCDVRGSAASIVVVAGAEPAAGRVKAAVRVAMAVRVAGVLAVGVSVWVAVADAAVADTRTDWEMNVAARSARRRSAEEGERVGLRCLFSRKVRCAHDLPVSVVMLRQQSASSIVPKHLLYCAETTLRLFRGDCAYCADGVLHADRRMGVDPGALTTTFLCHTMV